jgi:hypothetical protein
MENDDNDFEEAEEVDFDSDWLALDLSCQIEWDEQWVTYLAQTDPPSNVEGVDTSISDFEDERQEQHHA